jgi:syntaxin-binding protein 1
MTTSNLQKLVGTKLISEMLRCDSVRQRERSDWKVLVMDRLATRIISASCKMHDIMSEGITIVEDIMKKREPLGMLEAVYFIQPTEKSVNELINDFDKAHALVPKYKAAHVFFTEACNSELFTRLTQSKCAKYIKTLKEVNIAFLPYERQVFTLDSPDTFYITYNPIAPPQRTAHLDVIAEQIATLCATLGEYPTIRYRGDNEKMVEFAHAVQQKLNQYKADDATMGEGADKAKSVLLLLDRGFDAVSPLLHELTFQAMAQDLLKIENDVFEYEVQTPGVDPKINPGQKQKVLLDENDELWTELRHQHIAVVTQSITKKIKDFAIQKRVKDPDRGERTTMKDLSLMIKKMPQYQKELNAYALHFNIAEQCMNTYNRDAGEKLCSVEQNLAMGTDHEGERIKDHMRNIVPLLLDTAIAIEDKLRIIMLYILHKNGITEENLDKLLSHALIPTDKKNIITNMQHLNLQIIQDQSRVSFKKKIH